MAAAIVPAWVIPAEARVREARARAGARLESSGREARYRGVVTALDWVAGVRASSPVTEVDDLAAPGRALVEVLAAEQALNREPRSRPDRPVRTAAEDEQLMERLGRGVHVAAVLARTGSGRLRDEDIRFLDGALDTLRWLLGETDRPPVALPTEE